MKNKTQWTLIAALIVSLSIPVHAQTEEGEDTSETEQKTSLLMYAPISTFLSMIGTLFYLELNKLVKEQFGRDLDEIFKGHLSRSKLMREANKYTGKMSWVPESQVGWYRNRGGVLSDLKLMYWSSAGDVFRVSQKIFERRTRILTYDQNHHEKMKMCCWEFCWLSLLDAGLITPEQMNQLQFIAAHLGNPSVDAMYFHRNTLQRFSATNTPRPGDMIFYFRVGNYWTGSQLEIGHASIYMGSGDCIELDHGTPRCGIKAVPLHGSYTVYFVRLDDVIRNLESYIEFHWSEDIDSVVLSYSDVWIGDVKEKYKKNVQTIH